MLKRAILDLELEGQDYSTNNIEAVLSGIKANKSCLERTYIVNATFEFLK